jgi:hypothetical protein
MILRDLATVTFCFRSHSPDLFSVRVTVAREGEGEGGEREGGKGQICFEFL